MRAHTFELRLIVTDENGAYFSTATIVQSGISNWGWGEPDWFDRGDEEEDAEGIRAFARVIGCGSRRGPWPVARSEDGVFALGRFRERTRCADGRDAPTWRVEGRSSVRIRSAQDDVGTRHAISVPLAPIHEAITLPDGTRAVDVGARITARAYAARGSRHDAMRQPIEVTARLGGYERLEFEYLPAAPVPRLIMVPEEPEK